MANRFSECTAVDEVIRQAVGAGSACWENVSAAGVFDSTEAAKVADEAYGRVMELVVALVAGRQASDVRARLIDVLQTEWPSSYTDIVDTLLRVPGIAITVAP